MGKSTTIWKKYNVTSSGNSLLVDVLKKDQEELEAAGAANQTRMNTWLDVSPDESDGKTVEVETLIQSGSSTVADFKNSLIDDLDNYRDNILPLVSSFLGFAYAVEIGKQWDTPLDPLNLVYDETDGPDGTVKAFMRKPHVKDHIDDAYIEEVFKMLTYLYYPVELPTEDYTTKDYVDYYDEFNQTYDEDQNNPTKVQSGEAENEFNLISDLYDVFLDDSHSYHSVRAILTEMGREDIALSVENSEAVTDSATPVNLENFLDGTGDDEQEPDYSNMSPKERQRAEYEAARAKKKAEKEAKKANKQGHPLLKTLAILGIISAIGYGGYTYMNQQKANQQAAETSSSSSDKTDPKENQDFKEGLSAAKDKDYKSASDSFDKAFSSGVKGGSLDEEETSEVFSSYLNTGNYQKILDNIGSDQTATAMINYMILNKKKDQISNLNSDLAIVKFAKADIKHDYASMVDESDKIDISKNYDYQKDLAMAFAKTGKLSEGKAWAEKQSNSKELTDAIRGYAMNMPNHDNGKIKKVLG